MTFNVPMGTFILVYALARFGVPALSSTYAPSARNSEHAEHLLLDPEAGMQLNVPEALPEGKNLIVFVAGSCSDCVFSNLLTFAAGSPSELFVRQALVLEGDAEKLEQRLLAVLPDTDVRVHRVDATGIGGWNAFFFPRIYAINGEGNLLYTQHPSTPSPMAVQEAHTIIEHQNPVGVEAE